MRDFIYHCSSLGKWMCTTCCIRQWSHSLDPRFALLRDARRVTVCILNFLDASVECSNALGEARSAVCRRARGG